MTPPRLEEILGSVLGLSGVGGGDAPLWSITLAFATISLVGAIVGYVAGLAVRLVVARVRRRRAGRVESKASRRDGCRSVDVPRAERFDGYAGE